ncbi:hypothetical protein SAMN05444157_1615 [Frankineae bacterium MT45]|nr:hypothetical protein SAMN05444157_1615 [Frankineae bacterium MT45]
MRRDRLIRKSLRKRYLVTLTSGEAFDGVLVDADDAHIVLVDAESVSPNNDRLKVDGQLWLPRANVTYLQLPRV